MPIAPGTLIGPYEILSAIGAGGMGEVYRARDSRLRRDVALKVLPTQFATDLDRLRRFEQEARAAGMLDHTNIVVVHDIGTHDGAPYVVMEYLEGETLRHKLKGVPLSPKRALDYALQIAHGLTAAHEKGIIHRDIKPENLFVTTDGHVKILDFGVAKLVPFKPPSLMDHESPTVSIATEEGAVMGTVGYMSPEQIRGLAADQRSDIFSFGTVLFEMLTGRKTFPGDSAIEVLNAILKIDPPAPSSLCGALPPVLDALVLRCLEKDPKERFQSMRDCAFLLEALSAVDSAASRPTARPIPRGRWRTLSFFLALGVGLALGGAAAWIFLGGIGPRRSPARYPSFKQITFHRGTVYSARFSADAATIVYSASWEGRPKELFALSVSGGGSRPLGFVNGDIAGLSPSEEMLVLLRPDKGFPPGMLARMPLAGGPPRDIMENVGWADWNMEGTAYTVVRSAGNTDRLEYPAGSVLAESRGSINYPRLSPQGDFVAFLEHPSPFDDAGSLVVAGPKKARRALSSGWNSIEGLGWNPDGSEVWFTAAREGTASALYSVTLDGKERLLVRAPGRLVLHDVSRRAQAVAERNSIRLTLMGKAPGWEAERDFSWLDYSQVADLSADGGTILFTEMGEGVGKTISFYLRKTDGTLPIRLGEGRAMGLSPDGRWVLARSNGTPQRLEVWPTGPGEMKPLPSGGIQTFDWAGWLPDGQRIVISGSEAGKKDRLYEQAISGGPPKAITREGVSCDRRTISPDGKWVIARDGNGFAMFPMEGGAPKPIDGLAQGDRPLCFTSDGHAIYVRSRESMPGRVLKLDTSTGKRTPWKELLPVDCAGVLSISRILITPDGSAYVYNYARLLSDLYLIEDIK
jgi:hypothetical protein